MKNRIINGNPLEFFNSSNEKKGEIKISGSDIIINPLDSSGTVIFGEEGTINDIEIGGSGTPVDFTFLGGGTIAANGNTITIGESGDTIDLSNATIGTITASIFKGGVFEGDGSGLIIISEPEILISPFFSLLELKNSKGFPSITLFFILFP